jgi:hypothetical protein
MPFLIAFALAFGAGAARALDVTAGSGAATECPGPAPRLHVAAAAFLEPAPLSSYDEYGGNRYAPDRGSNLGVGVGFAELSASVHSWCFGLLYRAELEGTGSQDLLDVLHGDHEGRPFDAGRTYELQYEGRLLKARGLRVRRVFEMGQAGAFHFTFGAGVSLLKATQARHESISGAVTAGSTDYAVGTATWTRTNSDIDPADFNPFVGAGDPRGWGFSTDLHLKALARNGTAIEIVVMDAAGRIYWRDMRNSVRNFNNASIRYDSNANRAAFVNGIDSRIESTQRIPAKYHIALAHPVGSRLTLLAADDSVQGIHFVSFGARYGTSERSAAATFDTRTHAVGLSARWEPFGISLTTNRLHWRDASALGLAIEVSALW